MNAAANIAETIVAPEDQARANWYSLIARLLHDGPDEKLMAAIANADEMTDAEADAPLAIAWHKLQQAAAVIPAQAACDEHQILFVGVGKSEVSPYGSHYAPYLKGTQFLAAVRGELNALGLARHHGSSVPEDHMAALADVMRFLAAGNGNNPAADIAVQQRFFNDFVASWQQKLFTAVEQSVTANFYKRVAQFAQAFLAVESESFQML